MANFLSNLAYVQELTDYAVGQFNDSKNVIADFIAPTVQVATPTGYFKKFSNRQAFQAVDTRRALGGAARRLTFDATDGQFNCQPQALETAIDQFLVGDGIDPKVAMNLYQGYTNYLTSVAAVAYETSVFNFVQTQVTAQSGIGTGWTAMTGSTATANPLREIESQVFAMATNIGVMPNRIVFGPNAWLATKYNANTRALFGLANTVSNGQVMDQLSSLGLETKVAIVASDANNLGQTTKSNSVIAGTNDIWIFYASPAPSIFDRTAVKVFQVGQGFGGMKTYWEDPSNSNIFRMDWSFDIQMASSEAIRRITVS